MNYRDEEDIFEEDVVFDQAGLLSSARKRGKSAIRRVSSGRCAMLSKTLALCGAFFGLGLAFALPGPATQFLPSKMSVDDTSGEDHLYRCFGFMLGSMLGGLLLDRFNRLFLVFLALLVCAVLVAMVPWTGVPWLLRSDLILLGATMGFLLTGGNVLCLDLWGQNSRPFMQALHFSFSLGAFLALLIARPSSPVVATVAPTTVHTRFPRALTVADGPVTEGDHLSSQQLQNSSVTSAPLSHLSYNTSTLSLPGTAMITDNYHLSNTSDFTKLQVPAFIESSSSPFTTTHNSSQSSTRNTTSLPIKSSSIGSKSLVNNNGTAVPADSPINTGLSTSTSSPSPPTSTSSTNVPLSTSNLSFTVPSRSMSSTFPTSSTTSTSLTSITDSSISTGSTTTSKSAEGTGISPSTISTTASPRVSPHKPKPPVNKGINLDKSRDWEKVHVGQPPEDDVEPSSSTKAPATSTWSTPRTTTTSTLSTKTNSKEGIITSSPTSTVSPGLLEETSLKHTNFSSVLDLAIKTKPKVSALNESKLGEDINQNLTILKSANPKITQPDASTQTDLIPASATENPDNIKFPTASASTRLPLVAVPISPSVLESPVESLPKSLTLTKKNSSTVESPATFRPFSLNSPSSSAAPITSSSPKSTTNETHVEMTSASRRHYSKPSSYDNDTEEIHTVIDEVADRAEKYGLNRLQLSYLLVAILLLVVSLLFLGFLCFNPRDPRSRSEEDVGGGRNNIIRPRLVRVMLTTVMMIFLAVSAGIQYSYGHLLVTFAMHSPVSLSYSTASALTATFWGAVTSTRLACILVASALSPGALLLMSVVLTCVATWLMLALSAQSAVALWVGSVLVAVGTASVLPSSFLWMQQHVHVSHHVAGMLVMGPAMGDMMFPYLAQRMMIDDPAGLLHLCGILTLGMIPFWVLTYRVAHHRRNSMCNRADPAEHSYQLASQTDEDDLLDLTLSPITHGGHGNASAPGARRSAHANANGNGVHPTGT